jgi:SnoaL-like domain
VYRSSPFREPHRGQDGIRDYWANATATQSNTRVRMGRPIVDRDRAAVEWWTTYTGADEGEGTLPGILILRFARDGRCAELREAWNWELGTHEPPPGWGE